MTEPLPHDEVQVWYALTDDAQDGDLPACLALLSDEERARYGRFVFDRDRREYLVAHALLRATLSRYAPLPPAAWAFELNPWGCPSLAREHGLPWLRFNLTHTHGLVACAVAREGEVGVDAEDTHRRGATLDVAPRFFSPSEVTALFALAERDRRARFFALWTLKEAYIKARGMGLAIPLDQFAFELSAGDDARVSVAFDPALGDHPDRWRFQRFQPTPRHVLAAARASATHHPTTFVLRRASPRW